MKWLVFAMLTLLAGCSGTRALLASKTVPYATLEQTVQPGSSTREQVRAALGDSTAIRFDSGNDVRLQAAQVVADDGRVDLHQPLRAASAR